MRSSVLLMMCNEDRKASARGETFLRDAKRQGGMWSAEADGRPLASAGKGKSGGFDRLQDEIYFAQAALLSTGHDIGDSTILDGLIGKQSYIRVSAFG